jgi:cyclase
MRPAVRLLALSSLLATVPAGRSAELPKMKFNEVKEVAPGVFFRYSAISPTNPSIFGGSNNIWVVFKDYVVVIDANFPKEAGDVLAAVRRTTKKPVRYVLDTHHHGDHAYGNAVWVKAGASIVAQANCARLLRVNGPKEFAEAGRGPAGRKDVARSKLEVPTLVFDDKLVLDDGKQRVEFRFFGHAHTPGDAVAYLPKHKVLCTGDACVNGAYNFMGHSDSASWVRALERMQGLDVELVCPGHGPVAGKDLLERQKRYFVEMRRAVKKGIDEGQEVDDVIKRFKPAWYKEWTGVDPSPDNVRHVYGELTGRVAPADLAEEFGIYAGPSPTKDTPGWTKPRRIVVPSGIMPARLAELKKVAPEVEFIPARNAADVVKAVKDADALLGLATPELVKLGKRLRWVQAGREGVSKELLSALKGRDVVLTNLERINGPDVADQTFALLLALTRKLAPAGAKGPRLELRGKTMLVLGLHGTGNPVARRANAFGMRVLLVDPRPGTKPDYVFRLEKPDRLMEWLPKVDVVVLARPLTEDSRGLIGTKQLQAMKKSAYLVNAAHTGLVDLAALDEALREGRLAGAGLDLTDAAASEAARALVKRGNVIVTSARGESSPEARERQWRVYRENVRRFVAGEPLLCVENRPR